MPDNLPPLAGPVDASGEPKLRRLIKKWRDDAADYAAIPFDGLSAGWNESATARLRECADELEATLAAAVPSSPAQEDVHPSQLLMDVLKQASVFDEVLGRVQMYGAADRVRDAWRLLKDAILTVHRAAIPPSSPVADSPAKVTRRWTEVLCQKCGGNGVIKIPGGVSECPRCYGRCYDPAAPASAPSPSAGAAQKTETTKI